MRPALFSTLLRSVAALLLTAALFTSASAQSSLDTPIAWWRAENSTVDSASGNAGIVIGNLTYTQGKVGQAFLFDGSTAAVTATGHPQLLGTTPFTLSAWIKTTSTDYGIILEQRDPGEYNGEYMLYTSGATTQAPAGQVCFFTFSYDTPDPGLNFCAVNPVNHLPVNDGGFHLVNVVREDDGTAFIYIDGAQAATSQATPTPFHNISVNIGADMRDRIWFFNGAIDDVRIYNRALSAEDIQTLFVSPAPSDHTPPTVSAVVWPGPRPTGWNNYERVTINAVDDVAGCSGVRYVTYALSGAMTNMGNLNGCTGSVDVWMEGTTTVNYTATDYAGNMANWQSVTLKVDYTPPVISISAPSGTYTLNQNVAASYSCSDRVSGVAFCNGTVANGAPLPTSAVGNSTFLVTARDVAGNDSSASASYAVAYAVCGARIPPASSEDGSTLPIRLSLCDANGVNYSSAAVPVVEVGVTSSTGAMVAAQTVDGSGAFKLVGNGAYQLNLKTTGLAPDVYTLYFKAGSDPTMHAVQFTIQH